MCEDATVLKKTFALTAQRRKGTIVILDVQAKIRRIPAKIISDNEEKVEITTDPRYLPGIEQSVGFVIEPIKEEPADSEEEPDDVAEAEGDSNKENVATYQHIEQTNQQTLIIDLTLSDSEDDEDDKDDIRSDTTEVNPDIPSAVPLAAPPINHQTPQPPTREQPDSAQMERIPSPSPPCYHPPQHFQNMYAPPIMLQSEGEYYAQREVLIQQYLRDSLDLYYKYEFQALKLKRARDVLINPIHIVMQYAYILFENLCNVVLLHYLHIYPKYRAIYYAVSRGQSTTPYLKVTVLRSTLMAFSIAPSHLLPMQLHPGLRHTLQ
ncbi:hypothetical protein DAPPUDRAFT_116850 [Daphnia pulex]|uniref:Uncharacterized protein n=1 Tax=Daphnia pulex TaxID=6669 RepID=E9HQR1_DAPPU|nr:hypothetical protein DAPPUDRAFT_116850 [Daphnia pulex]|eukprot:EFX65919.1 hypothetical protein DAPPUDRAFT_116850 [Daphnia pulex]